MPRALSGGEKQRVAIARAFATEPELVGGRFHTRCRFHTSCPSKVGRICEEVEPPWQHADGTRWLACHISLEDLRNEAPVRPARAAGA